MITDLALFLDAQGFNFILNIIVYRHAVSSIIWSRTRHHSDVQVSLIFLQQGALRQEQSKASRGSVNPGRAREPTE
jgi:hypothetical protein